MSRPSRARIARSATVLGLTAVLTVGPIVAPAVASSGTLVLSAASEPVGPVPAPRDAEDNPARDLGGYDDREVPFTWGAAWLLTFLGLGGFATMILVYYRAVDRPGRDGVRRA